VPQDVATLQRAIAQAQPGDTIVLDATATRSRS